MTQSTASTAHIWLKRLKFFTWADIQWTLKDVLHPKDRLCQKHVRCIYSEMHALSSVFHSSNMYHNVIYWLFLLYVCITRHLQSSCSFSSKLCVLTCLVLVFDENRWHYHLSSSNLISFFTHKKYTDHNTAELKYHIFPLAFCFLLLLFVFIPVS